MSCVEQLLAPEPRVREINIAVDREHLPHSNQLRLSSYRWVINCGRQSRIFSMGWNSEFECVAHDMPDRLHDLGRGLRERYFDDERLRGSWSGAWFKRANDKLLLEEVAV